MRRLSGVALSVGESRRSDLREGGKWQLAPAWLSKDIGPGEEAIEANGVLFTYVSGEDVRVTRRTAHGMSRPQPPEAQDCESPIPRMRRCTR